MEGCATDERKDFYLSRREGSWSFIIQRCSNNRGHFVEVAVYCDGGRNSFILIPKEVGSCRWSRMSEALREGLHVERSINGTSSGVLKRPWGDVAKEKSYKEALLPAGTQGALRIGAGRGSYDAGILHRAPRGQSWEKDGGGDVRKVLCMVCDLQVQMGKLQGEVAKVLEFVEAFKAGDETGSFSGRNRPFRGQGLWSLELERVRPRPIVMQLGETSGHRAGLDLALRPSFRKGPTGVEGSGREEGLG